MNGPSKTEDLLYEAMLVLGLKPIRQYSISKMHVDFAFPNEKLVVEVDGAYKRDKEGMKTLFERTRVCKDNGWNVENFTAEQVYENPEVTAWRIYEILENLKKQNIENEKEKANLKDLLKKLDTEKTELIKNLKKIKESKVKGKIRKKIKKISKEYKETNEKLKKIKEGLNKSYGYTKKTIKFLSERLKYISWILLITPFILWIFQISNLWAIFFLKVLAAIVLLRILIYLTAKKLHYKIQTKERWIKEFKKNLNYICALFVIAPFVFWIFQISNLWAIFFLKVLAALVILRIVLEINY